jgi:hypothetical protein
MKDVQGTPEMQEPLNNESKEALTVTTRLLESFSNSHSRRWLLGGAVAGGAALVGAGALSLHATQAHAEVRSSGSQLTTLFSILATGEALAETFYQVAIAHRVHLLLNHIELNALEAIVAEEELHREFAVANGGVAATTTFSFPHGQATFENRRLFLETQQTIEELTSGALVAWIKDLATMGNPRLAQIGGQLMQVEGGHRTLGRVFQGAEPLENWAFAPVVLESFTDVPAAVQKAGFLSPVKGNSFTLKAAKNSFPGVINTTP